MNPARTPADVSAPKFLIFGLGNSRAYPDRYQRASKTVEARLKELGATLLMPRGEVRVGVLCALSPMTKSRLLAC